MVMGWDGCQFEVGARGVDIDGRFESRGSSEMLMFKNGTSALLVRKLAAKGTGIYSKMNQTLWMLAWLPGAATGLKGTRRYVAELSQPAGVSNRHLQLVLHGWDRDGVLPI